MDITTYINELLYEHECVVIPGLGGFIVNDRPATINRITHEFSPPFRKVMFNVHLSANDGLLMNHIANTEGVTYLEAKKWVLHFSKYCQEELKQGNSIDLKEIGTLYKNKEGYISFEQDKDVNHNAEAFGLGSFYSPPIERPTDEERIKNIVEPILSVKTKPKARKPEANRQLTLKRRRRAGVIILSLFILLLGIGGGYTLKEDATQYFKSYAMLIPSFSLDEKVTQPENIMLDVQKDIPIISLNKVSVGTSPESNPSAMSTESDEPQPSGTNVSDMEMEKNENAVLAKAEILKGEIRLPEFTPASKPYLIITGSFSEESNAKKLVIKLRKAGVNALIADTTKNGMYRVAYASFENIDQAKKELYALRDKAYPDAWILKKK